jgi:biotin carboxyl carrier protein
VYLQDGETIERVETEPHFDHPHGAHHRGRGLQFTLDGESFSFRIPDYAADAEAALGGDNVKSPMPGKLIAIRVKPGDAVKRGDTLAVMEAMKMEHSLASPRDGIVESINGTAGQQLSEGIVLVALKSEA